MYGRVAIGWGTGMRKKRGLYVTRYNTRKKQYTRKFAYNLIYIRLKTKQDNISMVPD